MGTRRKIEGNTEKEKKEQERLTRLQRQLTQEVEAEKKKGLFGLW